MENQVVKRILSVCVRWHRGLLGAGNGSVDGAAANEHPTGNRNEGDLYWTRVHYRAQAQLLRCFDGYLRHCTTRNPMPIAAKSMNHSLFPARLSSLRPGQKRQCSAAPRSAGICASHPSPTSAQNLDYSICKYAAIWRLCCVDDTFKLMFVWQDRLVYVNICPYMLYCYKIDS